MKHFSKCNSLSAHINNSESKVDFTDIFVHLDKIFLFIKPPFSSIRAHGPIFSSTLENWKS